MHSSMTYSSALRLVCWDHVILRTISTLLAAGAIFAAVGMAPTAQTKAFTQRIQTVKKTSSRPSLAGQKSAHTTPARHAKWRIASSRVASARRYARSRQGSVAFAVLDGSGVYRGLNLSTHYYSASVVKAMLLVEVLRNAGEGHLSDFYRERLGPMIEESNDEDAEEIYNRIANAGLYAVARAAGMTHFAVQQLFNAQLTVDDQARFFMHIDQLVPAVHRSYERRLLSSIVDWQRWGIAPVAERQGIKIFFKGGWREGIVNQSALLEHNGKRISLSILTSSDPSMAYGEQTLSGIARRLLG